MGQVVTGIVVRFGVQPNAVSFFRYELIFSFLVERIVIRCSKVLKVRTLSKRVMEAISMECATATMARFFPLRARLSNAGKSLNLLTGGFFFRLHKVVNLIYPKREKLQKQIRRFRERIPDLPAFLPRLQRDMKATASFSIISERRVRRTLSARSHLCGNANGF